MIPGVSKNDTRGIVKWYPGYRQMIPRAKNLVNYRVLGVSKNDTPRYQKWYPEVSSNDTRGIVKWYPEVSSNDTPCCVECALFRLSFEHARTATIMTWAGALMFIPTWRPCYIHILIIILIILIIVSLFCYFLWSFFRFTTMASHLYIYIFIYIIFTCYKFKIE